MSRVYNFSAGPSMLPETVLKQAAAEMLDYQGSGQSVMEMSHRSKTYQAIIDSCSSLLREVLKVPEDYEILFLQGGASSQFAMLPLNLATKSGSADFVITGQWAKKAYAECKKLAKAREVASSADKTFTYIPRLDPGKFDPNADYFHICWNNTIYGTRYIEIQHFIGAGGRVEIRRDLCWGPEEYGAGGAYGGHHPERSDRGAERGHPHYVQL